MKGQAALLLVLFGLTTICQGLIKDESKTKDLKLSLAKSELVDNSDFILQDSKSTDENEKVLFFQIIN